MEDADKLTLNLMGKYVTDERGHFVLRSYILKICWHSCQMARYGGAMCLVSSHERGSLANQTGWIGIGALVILDGLHRLLLLMLLGSVPTTPTPHVILEHTYSAIIVQLSEGPIDSWAVLVALFMMSFIWDPCRVKPLLKCTPNHTIRFPLVETAKRHLFSLCVCVWVFETAFCLIPCWCVQRRASGRLWTEFNGSWRMGTQLYVGVCGRVDWRILGSHMCLLTLTHTLSLFSHSPSFSLLCPFRPSCFCIHYIHQTIKATAHRLLTQLANLIWVHLYCGGKEKSLSQIICCHFSLSPLGKCVR